VDQDEAALDVHQRPVAQPGEQVGAVGRGQDLVEAVEARLAAQPGGGGQEVHVVVAEHADHAVALPLRPAQHVERARAAVDQVAGDPQAVDLRLVADAPEQPLEGGEAALDVADGVGGHYGAPSAATSASSTTCRASARPRGRRAPAAPL
jgi:hypothetical protein